MKKAMVITLYVLFFWAALPGALVLAAVSLDRSLRLAPVAPAAGAGWSVVAVFSSLLLLALVQYARAAGELPVSAYPPGEIIRRGVFATWRHPIYLFSLGVWAGAALLSGSRALRGIVLPSFAALVALYAGIEERFLLRRFGGDYRAHREQTGLILPRLHQGLKPLFFVASRLLFPIEIRNRQNIPRRAPFFVVSSHRNYLDALLIAYALPYKVHNVTTYEMFRRPLTRFFLRRLGCLPAKRYARDPGAVRAVMSALARGGVIGLFPEGERSFTGEILDFKPEALKLLTRGSGVPVLPVALSGNFLMWPRWGARPRRCPVTIEFKPPIHAVPGESAAEFGARLAVLVTPDDAGKTAPSSRRAHHIQQILYRCPDCRRFDSLRSDGADFHCQACNGRFHLDPGYAIEAPPRPPRSLAEAYAAIRVTGKDVEPATDDGLIVRSGRARIARERGRKLATVCRGRLALFPDRLRIEPENGAGENAGDFSLDALAAVTIEGCAKLQWHAGNRLWQAVFLDEAAKKWQDYILAARGAFLARRASGG